MNHCDCCFCWENIKKENRAILYETEWNYAIYDIYPVNKGHVLIISKQHYENWFSMPVLIQHDTITVLNRMKEYLDLKFAPEGYNIGMNCGKFAGQTIFHHHIHIIPRYVGDCSSPEGGVRGVIKEKKSYNCC